MKKQWMVIVLMALCSAGAYAQEAISWKTNFEEAKKEAAVSGRLILVSFSGSDWCANCMRLDKELFHHASFQGFSDEQFVLLNLDFPAKKKNKLSDELTQQNEQLFEKYNTSKSFPMVVVLDAKGNKIGTMKYPLAGPEAYIKNLTSIAAGK